MVSTLKFLCLLAGMISLGLSAAGATTFDVAASVGQGFYSGFIQTDGTTGPITAGNITGFDLHLNDGISAFELIGQQNGVPNSQVSSDQGNLSVVANNMFFNFSGLSGFLLFEAFASPNQFLCFGAVGECTSSGSAIALFAGGQTVSAAQSGNTLIGTAVTATPLPAALPLFATGLAMTGLLGWRKKRKAAAALAAA
jgi:hypothetical protein